MDEEFEEEDISIEEIEEEITKKDYENLLLIKNQLITVPTDNLKEMFSDVGAYLSFIDNVNCLLSNESAFLYLSKDFLRKIRDVLEVHRYDLDDEKLKEYSITADEVYESVNGIMPRLNAIDSERIEYRRLVAKSYMQYHENIRSVAFDKLEDFASCLAYDAPVYFTLTGEFNKPISEKMAMPAINYFLETAPAIFSDKRVLERTMNVVENVRKKCRIIDIADKILIKQAKQKLKVLSQEE